MTWIRGRRALFVRYAALMLVATACVAAGADSRVAAQGQGVPARLSDVAFWRMVTDFSEESGFFRSDNFVSNEVTFQHVIPELKRSMAPGGVYLGVGPDQNFTYVIALQPKIAFIVDIRRQNMLQHLLYKALIETSSDRAEFLSRLFSRRRPRGLGANVSPDSLFGVFALLAPDSTLFRRNLAAVTRQLVDQHRFALTDDDLRSLEYVYTAFYSAGPDLTYSFSGAGPSRFGSRRMPTYAELMVETDGEGTQRSYLASEENFKALRELQRRNLVVPLVGNFAGDKALRSVATYLEERGATVSAFYTSNVEQYLFRQDDEWRRFLTNVAALPVDSASTFIRAVFNYPGSYSPTVSRGPRSITMLGSIVEHVAAFTDGRIQTYFDVVQMSR